MARSEDAGEDRPKHALRRWLPALGLLVASFAASTWLTLRPTDDRLVAAVFPLWWSAGRSADAVIAADGAIVGWGGLSSIILTRSDRTDFRARLREAGAVLLLDPSRLSFCARRPNLQATKEHAL